MRNLKLSAIAALYMSSSEFHELSDRTRELYAGSLRYFTHLLGMKANDISRPIVIDLKDRLYHKPSVCKLSLAVLSNILQYGYDRGMCDHNHAARIKKLPKNKAFPRWTDEECSTFLKGARASLRRAFLLALYTGQRASDLAKMRWAQYDGETISVWQVKTKTFLKIPVHPELKAELDLMQEEIANRQTTLVPCPYIISNAHGHPWSASTLSKAFHRRLKDVGVEGRCIHGLRKTCAAKLAEAGCSPHLIQAITGHKSLKEVMNYTAEADQVRMAKDAMERWSNVA